MAERNEIQLETVEGDQRRQRDSWAVSQKSCKQNQLLKLDFVSNHQPNQQCQKVNTYVGEFFRRASCHGHQAEWIWNMTAHELIGLYSTHTAVFIVRLRGTLGCLSHNNYLTFSMLWILVKRRCITTSTCTLWLSDCSGQSYQTFVQHKNLWADKLYINQC